MSNKLRNALALKKLIKITAFLLVYLLLFYGTLCLARYFTKEEPIKNELPPEAFYEPDYTVDISENAAYQALNHSVLYMSYGTGESLTEENHETLGVASSFFYDYFARIIEGNASAYLAMLTDAYIDTFNPPKKFTPQMLYDIQVNQSHSASTATYQGNTVSVYHFTVSYKIFENNGTFRRDIASNQSVTQYYDLIMYDNRLLLHNISDGKIISADDASTLRNKELAVDLCVVFLFTLLPVVWFVASFMRKRKAKKYISKD